MQLLTQLFIVSFLLLSLILFLKPLLTAKKIGRSTSEIEEEREKRYSNPSPAMLRKIRINQNLIKNSIYSGVIPSIGLQRSPVTWSEEDEKMFGFNRKLHND